MVVSQADGWLNPSEWLTRWLTRPRWWLASLMVGSTQVSGCLGDQVRKELYNCAYMRSVQHFESIVQLFKILFDLMRNRMRW